MRFFMFLGAALWIIANPSLADGAFDGQMKSVLHPYDAIHKELYREDQDQKGFREALKPHVAALAEAAKTLDSSKVTGVHANHYRHIPRDIRAAAAELGTALDRTAAREAFKKLSRPIAMWLGMAKISTHTVRYCPMAKASWVQAGAKAVASKNPYYGEKHKMHACGDPI